MSPKGNTFVLLCEGVPREGKSRREDLPQIWVGGTSLEEGGILDYMKIGKQAEHQYSPCSCLTADTDVLCRHGFDSSYRSVLIARLLLQLREGQAMSSLLGRVSFFFMVNIYYK